MREDPHTRFDGFTIVGQRANSRSSRTASIQRSIIFKWIRSIYWSFLTTIRTTSTGIPGTREECSSPDACPSKIVISSATVHPHGRCGRCCRRYQRFLASPASYLLEVGAERIGRVVMIEPGGEPPPEVPDEGGEEPPSWPPHNNIKERLKKRAGLDSPLEGCGPEDDQDLGRLKDRPSQIAVARSRYLDVGSFVSAIAPQTPEDLKTWWSSAEPAWRSFQSSSKETWIIKS